MQDSHKNLKKKITTEKPVENFWKKKNYNKYRIETNRVILWEYVLTNSV